MKLDFAKYTPMDSCDNIRSECRGSNKLFVLANGKNEPKGNRRIASKLSKVLMESFLKRPSMKKVAFEKIADLGNNAVLAAQSPNYRTQCEYLLLALRGNKIRWSRNGDVTLLHFANGELISRTENKPALPLGDALDVEAEVYDTEVLENKRHFLIAFSDAFKAAVPLQSIERCVRGTASAQALLNNLMQQYSKAGSDENVSLFALHLPPRKKKLILLILIPLIAALIFFIIGALGRMRPPM